MQLETGILDSFHPELHKRLRRATGAPARTERESWGPASERVGGPRGRRPADLDVLVLEDRGLTPLSARLAAAPLTLDEFFEIANGLCDALAELHARDFVVGAINPQSILVGPA